MALFNGISSLIYIITRFEGKPIIKYYKRKAERLIKIDIFLASKSGGF